MKLKQRKLIKSGKSQINFPLIATFAKFGCANNQPMI